MKVAHALRVGLLASVFVFFACSLRDAGAAVTAGASGAIAADPAARPVERFHSLLINTMKQSGALDARARRSALQETMKDVFDFRRMAQIAVGPEVWAAATADQREQLTRAFSDMSISTYAAQFRGWSGERFETLAVEPGPRQARLVRTRLVLPSHDPIALTYVMTPSKDGAWRVTDILIKDSISEIAVRRADYAGPLRDNGIGFLIARLDTQAAKLVEGQP